MFLLSQLPVSMSTPWTQEFEVSLGTIERLFFFVCFKVLKKTHVQFKYIKYSHHMYNIIIIMYYIKFLQSIFDSLGDMEDYEVK